MITSVSGAVISQEGDRDVGPRTDVTVDEPIVGGATYGAFDAHQTVLFGPGEQGRRGRICLWGIVLG